MRTLSRTRATVVATAALLVATAAGPAAADHPTTFGCTDDPTGLAYVADSDGDGAYSVVVRGLLSRCVATVLPEPTDETSYLTPELSPDRSRLALSSDRGGTGAPGIAVVDGHGFRRVTTPPENTTSVSFDIDPAWSPDGSTLLFTRVTFDDEDVTGALYRVPAAGGTPTLVPTGTGSVFGADWDPTGQRIVYALGAADAASGTLHVQRLDGSERRSLGVQGDEPSWSPDGSLIAYSTVTSPDAVRGADVRQIATVPAEGGTQRVLQRTRPTGARTAADSPSWAPDSQSIFFTLSAYDAEGELGNGDVWAVDRLDTRSGAVVTGPGDESQATAFGQRLEDVRAGQRSTFTPVTPQRVLDTRNGTGAPARKVGPRGTVELQLRGLETASGRVPDTATAVILNVTVTGADRPTDVRLYPSGGAVPTVSNINAGRNQTVPNLVTVALGPDGGVTLRNESGGVHLIADLAGWYVPGEDGAGFAALDPSRVLDTRDGLGARTGRVGAGETVDLQVTGTVETADGRTATVPATATAVVLNVTATSPSASTDVRLYPTPAQGQDRFPEVSNLNLVAGQTAANLVTVAVGEGGKVRLRNQSGAVHLIADLAGYYSEDAPGRFVPVTPGRFLDTRAGIGAAPVPTRAGEVLDLKVGGVRAVPATPTAVVLNLTGTGVTATTDVRAYPTGTSAVPTVSNLNLTRGTTRANLAVVRVGTDGRVRLRNQSGQLHLIADLSGYFVE